MTELVTKEFNFETMANEAYDLLSMKSKPKSMLILPDIVSEIGTTRLHWKNPDEILTVICRSHEHFIDWLISEIPDKKVNWMSSIYSDGLIIHGKYRDTKELALLIKKYINMYVVCMCKSTNTIMTKDKFICNDCGMSKFI